MNDYKDIPDNRALSRSMLDNAIDNRYYWRIGQVPIGPDPSPPPVVDKQLVTKGRAIEACIVDKTAPIEYNRIIVKQSAVGVAGSPVGAVGGTIWKVHVLGAYYNYSTLYAGNFSQFRDITGAVYDTGCLVMVDAQGVFIRSYDFYVDYSVLNEDGYFSSSHIKSSIDEYRKLKNKVKIGRAHV